MGNNRDPNPTIRHSQRVLLMVHELHKLGYQRLRIAPYMAPSGLYWRCTITHAANISPEHGAEVIHEMEPEVVRYTSGQGNKYFGWDDAQQDTARQLAAKFIERFPALVQKGNGIDWPYAGWYVQMMGFSERGAFPIAFADYELNASPGCLPTTKEDGLPMPPTFVSESAPH